MKNKFISFFSKHFYPQNIFARSIATFIDSTKDSIIIDAPCGNGETSWHLSSIKNTTVYGYDINPTSMQRAKTRYNKVNLFFEEKNILDLKLQTNKVDYFCIINAIFLLPNPMDILKNALHILKPQGLLFVITPNTKGKNFIRFQKHDLETNKLIIAREEIIPFFKNFNVDVVSINPIVYAHNFGRKDVKLFSIFSHFYLTLLNIFQTKLKLSESNYFLVVLKNKN